MFSLTPNDEFAMCLVANFQNWIYRIRSPFTYPDSDFSYLSLLHLQTQSITNAKQNKTTLNFYVSGAIKVAVITPCFQFPLYVNNLRFSTMVFRTGHYTVILRGNTCTKLITFNYYGSTFLIYGFSA